MDFVLDKAQSFIWKYNLIAIQILTILSRELTAT